MDVLTIATAIAEAPPTSFLPPSYNDPTPLTALITSHFSKQHFAKNKTIVPESPSSPFSTSTTTTSTTTQTTSPSPEPTLHAISPADIPEAWRPKQLERENRNFYVVCGLLAGFFVFAILCIWGVALCSCWWRGECFWHCEEEEGCCLGRGRGRGRKSRE
ncbi:hypothetical protein CC80DRAFT_80013 [Byssothecium circinans]|uniref:Uncharacterized protein n=1 Tax=Byssothecium circinans TaxID=147558 RepID=A0A6A5U3W9_9PLEO|nr:hypothetical protein CC80DRAFT_80013 [Byssothecium circinans]